MTVSGVLLTILWVVFIPAFIGAGIVLFPVKNSPVRAQSNDARTKTAGIFMGSWFCGQLLLWCTFQPIAVTEILKRNKFESVVKWFTVSVVVLAAVSFVFIAVKFVFMYEKRKESMNVPFIASETESPDAGGKKDCRDKKIIYIFWGIFFVILIIQIVLQAVLAYMEVDDSFYVSEAVEAVSSGDMYFKIPYTGYTTELDFRHSLEPFPIWLAYIARVTGTNTTVLAHVLLPVLLMPLTYGTYALMGSRLLGKNNRYLSVFMVFTEILVLFGYYSTKTPEKFFVTRIRQGKSALASLIIPGIILCLFVILEFIKENRKVDFRLWIMLFCLNMSGCLCSTLGAVLCTIPVMITAILIIFMYRKWKHLPGMIISCLPSIVFALMYLILG